MLVSVVRMCRNPGRPAPDRSQCCLAVERDVGICCIRAERDDAAILAEVSYAAGPKLQSIGDIERSTLHDVGVAGSRHNR